MAFDSAFASPAVYLAVAVLAALAGWFVARSRAAAQVDATTAQARAELQIEIAMRDERLRAADLHARATAEHLAEVRARAQQWRDELDAAINERSRLDERASRVPALESQLTGVQHRLDEAAAGLGRAEEDNAKLAERASRVARLDDELQQAQRASAELRQQLADLRAATSQEISRLAAELAGQGDAVTRLTTERDSARARLDQAEQRGATLSNELTELHARADKDRAHAREQLQLLQEARTALGDQFRNLANEILEEKSKRFAEQNQLNLGTLLEPLKTRLSEFQGKVEEVYVQESKDRSALQEQVRNLMTLNQTLSADAKNLTQALKGNTKTQGNWGELILERVLESSGLRKGIEYEVQDSQLREDGSRAIPDIVIRLPEERRLVVDAKVSLVAYERHVSAEDDQERAHGLKGHLESVRTHIRGLSDRRYQDLYGIKSLDFVLAFVPIEPAFMLAVSNDRNLFDEAWQRNVLLVSPSTLLFVVRTVAHLWRQEAQSRNAQDIAKKGAELYDKLCGFVTDLQQVGARLDQARDAYAKAENKLSTGKGNVIRQAEMLRDLGIKPGKALPGPLLEAAADDAAPAPAAANLVALRA